ncbi:hypothetical protein, partial [Spirosoma endophyticum]
GKVIFFSEPKVAKTISSLFTRICPLLLDDVQYTVTNTMNPLSYTSTENLSQAELLNPPLFYWVTGRRVYCLKVD